MNQLILVSSDATDTLNTRNKKKRYEEEREREREREGEVEEKKNKATDEIKLVTKERCMIHQQKEKYLLTSYS